MAKAIIFDLDGTIVDTENTVWRKAEIELLAYYNKKNETGKIVHIMYGASFEESTRILYDFYHIEDSFENFLKKRKEFVRKGFAENVAFMEGFNDFYKRLAGRKIAIATSMQDDFLALTLGHLPLKSLFNDHIYTIAESGGRGKPHPDIFLHAAKKIGEEPFNAIVIEDAPKGVTAAKNAGMKAIGLAKSVTPDKLSHADYVVNSFAEITEEMLS